MTGVQTCALPIFWTEQLELQLGWLVRFGLALLKPLYVAAVRASLTKFARAAEAL